MQNVICSPWFFFYFLNKLLFETLSTFIKWINSYCIPVFFFVAAKLGFDLKPQNWANSYFKISNIRCYYEIENRLWFNSSSHSLNKLNVDELNPKPNVVDSCYYSQFALVEPPQSNYYVLHNWPNNTHAHYKIRRKCNHLISSNAPYN